MPEIMEVARLAARAGGDVLREHFRRGVAATAKAGEASYNLVSAADLEAEQAVGSVIRAAFPHHAILGEETFQADADAELLWVVDPLDGTNNFVHQVPHFAVSIAFYQRQQAVCGVVYNPITEDHFEASRGAGATHGGRPIRVAAVDKLTESLIGVGFYYDRGAMMEATLAAIRDLFREQIHGIRRFGTASLDLCQVATGRYGAYFEYQLSPWDFAAGRLIVEEAGGVVTTCGGRPLPMAKTSLLASNGKLHDAVRRIAHSHWPHG